MSWPEPVERVSTVLRAAGVESRIEEFEEGTPTARDAARAVGCELAQIVKSIVFVCDGVYVLALVPGDRRADERLVAAAIGAVDVRAARGGEVVEATGFEAGGVAPFPQRSISRTLIDPSFLQYTVVWIGAGSPTHMASLDPVQLVRLSGAATVELGDAG
ncbi:MAG TPA: YbaK/EbsC family protein [Gaiellaceae bacterium]|nr:YbaK/EbsC family protein [Gaiellaceae bacterium]